MINKKEGRVTPGYWVCPAAQQKREDENINTLTSKHFLDACAAADIEPTKRQAVRFKNKRGIAYKFK